MSVPPQSSHSQNAPSHAIGPERSATLPEQDSPSAPPELRPQSGVPEIELVLARFRLLARCRGAWLQNLWKDSGTLDGRAMVTHSELAGVLADHDSPLAESEWAKGHPQLRDWRAELTQIERTLESLPDSRFARLVRIFGLGREEADLLQLCAALAFEPSLGRACAYLQDHAARNYLTEELAARLLGLGRRGAWVPEMNLFRWELVTRREINPSEPDILACDPQIVSWLQGRNTLDETLVDAASLVESSGQILPDWPVGKVAEWVNQSLEQEKRFRFRILVIAPHGGGKRDFTAAVSHQIGLPLLEINTDSSNESDWPKLFRRAQRQAFLDAAAPVWIGEKAMQRPWTASQIWFPVQFVLCEPGCEPAPIPGVLDRKVFLPIPSAKTRRQLWKKSCPGSAKWSRAEVAALAERHCVWPGDIQRTIRLGARNPRQAGQLVREAARARFGNLAQILECPFTKDDLVLSAGVKQNLESIAFEAEERERFWQQREACRLFPQGRGLIALFSGPPGTGKTMAAQVIAARLGQDLCRVNVAQLVSKWVGDTSKNCEQIIRLAAENNVVLFFDEADALFARRAPEIRDAQDKFANTDTAFLLQAIEGYPGVALLASNLKSNIDPAFVRRLRYVVEFPKPDAALQRELWTKLTTGLASKERARALAPVFDVFSTSINATGAQIKFAVLGALFAARAEKQPLNAFHLLIGLERELSKEGRTVGPRERDRILKIERAK